jgi:hypothetical protein
MSAASSSLSISPGRSFRIRIASAVVIACVAISSLLASGCASYDSKMRSWIGRSIDEVIQKNGYPNASADLPNGNRAYTWQFGRCVTLFESTSKGTIVSYSWRGDCD